MSPSQSLRWYFKFCERIHYQDRSVSTGILLHAIVAQAVEFKAAASLLCFEYFLRETPEYKKV